MQNRNYSNGYKFYRRKFMQAADKKLINE